MSEWQPAVRIITREVCPHWAPAANLPNPIHNQIIRVKPAMTNRGHKPDGRPVTKCRLYEVHPEDAAKFGHSRLAVCEHQILTD